MSLLGRIARDLTVSIGAISPPQVKLTILFAQIAYLGDANDVVVRLNCFATSFDHAAPSVEKQVWCHAVHLGYVRNLHARPVGLFDQPYFLLDRETPAALHACDYSVLLVRLSHKPRRMSRPSSYATCPVETGAAPSTNP